MKILAVDQARHGAWAVYDYEGNPMKKINLDIIASHMVYDKINKRVIFSPSMDNDLHVLDYEFE